MSTELASTQTAAAVGPRAGAVSGSLGATLGREVNAVFAIAWREILRAVKSPLSLAFTVIFPILFIGILGGSISQNLGDALPFDYLPFMLIGMIANTMYQGTITGVTNLVEERENDFTAELFVAPISRYAVLLGKLIGSGDRGDGLARRDRGDDLRHADPDERGRPAAGHRARADPGPRRRRARRASSSASRRTRRRRDRACRC